MPTTFLCLRMGRSKNKALTMNFWHKTAYMQKCGLIIKVLWIGKLERRWKYDELVKKSFCFERSGSKRSEQSNLVLYNYKFEPASSHVPNLYAAAAMDFPIDGVYGTEYEY